MDTFVNFERKFTFSHPILALSISVHACTLMDSATGGGGEGGGGSGMLENYRKSLLFGTWLDLGCGLRDI